MKDAFDAVNRARQNKERVVNEARGERNRLIPAARGKRDRAISEAEGYREKREEMLRDMALTNAAKAKEAEKEIVIRDLKAYERRIIHMTLVDDPDVETYSEGDDDDRQLVISPRVS